MVNKDCFFCVANFTLFCVMAFANFAQAETPRREVEGSLPQVISPLDDGRVVLFPETAQFFGQEIRINLDNFCIAWWSESEDYVTWETDLPAAGKYEVWIQWAIADDQAGNPFVVEVSQQQLKSKIAKSGGWTSFGHTSIGVLNLPAGKHRLVMRPEGKLNGELADIRVITLNPVGAATPPTAPDFPAKTPAASLSAIRVHPEMQVELVASEPLVRDPIAIAWGADLKLWVVEMGDYPLGKGGKNAAAGRVKYLEDTNADGEYDKATLFLENLSFPTGVLPWGKGILVTCAPDIFYAEDTDGDGQADHKKTLFTGFPERNQQHRVNGLRYGLDNWVYCANGDGGVGGETEITSTQTGQKLQLGTRDFRFRPETGEIEAQSGPTQFGRNQDNWGNWFGSNNAQPLYHFALDEHYMARNPRLAPPDPRVHQFNVGGPFYAKAPLIAFHGEQQTLAPVTRPVGLGGACSGMIYRDEFLGPAFAGNALVCDPVTNLVHRCVLQTDGLTFRSHRAADESESEFFASTDPWTRPTMVQAGPDGALYLVDMYRLYIEHPQWINESVKSRADLRAGNPQGRIYRIYPRNTKPRATQPLNQLNVPALVAALDSPSGWKRDTVQQRIVTENLRSAASLLKKLFASSQRPETRLQALTTLSGLNAADDELLLTALADSHPAVRRWGVKLSESRLNQAPKLASAVDKLAADADQKVVQQVAYSLGAWNDPKSGKQLAQLIIQHQDNPYLIAAALSSAPGHEVDLLKTLFAQADKVDHGLLSRVLASSLNPDDKSFREFAMWQLSLTNIAPASTTQLLLLASLLDDQAAAQQDWVRQLVPPFITQARKIVQNEESPVQTRSAAIRLLGREAKTLTEDVELLAEQLSPTVPLPVAEAAVDRLAELNDQQVGQVLVRHWTGLSPAMRSQVFEVLMARSEWSLIFVQAMKADTRLATSLDATRQQRLMKHPADKVRQAAEQILGSSQAPDRAKVILQYAKTVSEQGNAEHGKAVFKKNCSACHRLENIGHNVGPDLTALKEKSPQSILEAVLNPNRAVEDKFMAYNAVTADGRVLSGLVHVESGNSITLATAEGQKHVILRSQLDELVSTGRSLMPDGFEKTIPPTAMTDLLTYLSQLNLQSQNTQPSEMPTEIAADSSGTLQLLATQATLQGQHVGINAQAGCIAWMVEGEQAKWTITLAAAGEYEVHIEWAQIDELADNPFVIEAAGKKVTGKFATTHGWANYQTTPFGKLALPAGRTVLKLQPGGPVKTELADVRQIKLVPREK